MTNSLTRIASVLGATTLVAAAGPAHAGLTATFTPSPSVTPTIDPDVLAALLTFRKSFTRTDGFGNDEWGAGYSLDGSLTYQPVAVTGTSDVVKADGNLTAWARLAGTRRTIIDVHGAGYGEKGNSAATRFEVDVYAAGAQIYGGEWTGAFSQSRTYSRTFFTVSKTYPIAGVVPVTATISATGSIGFDLDGTVNPAGEIDVVFTPRGDAHAVAQAGVGLAGASAGVYGDLNLIRARLPTTARIELVPDLASHSMAVDYRLDSDLQLWSLDGEIGLYAELGDWRRELSLVAWDGFSTSIPVFFAAGTHCAYGTCP